MGLFSISMIIDIGTTKITPGKNTMKISTIATSLVNTQSAFHTALRPLRYAYSVIVNRHSVKTETVGIKYVSDYRDRYDWIVDNIPDFKKSVWVNCTIKRYNLTKPHNLTVVSELQGEFRFRRRADAMAFLMRWA